LSVELKIYDKPNVPPMVVKIKNGEHMGHYYSTIFIAEGNIILQGDESLLIGTETKYVTVLVQGVTMKVSEALGDMYVFTGGVDACYSRRDGERGAQGNTGVRSPFR